MCKDIKVLISLGSVFQEGCIKSKRKKIRDNNAGDNNIDTAQTKTKPPSLKKQRIKKYSDKVFTKIRLTLPKPKTLWFTCKNYNNVSNIPKA